MMHAGLRTLFYTLLIVSHAGFAADPATSPAQLGSPKQTGTLPTVIDESSGVVKSRRYPEKDIFWTHNDSGDTERIFAIDSKGNLLREALIPHATNHDWEEISIDDKGRIIVCDIGDNFSKRKTIMLYRIAEPDALNPKEPAGEPQIFEYRYPKDQGASDAEGLIVCGGYAYLFTKEIDRTRCYRLPLPEEPPRVGTVFEAQFLTETRTMSVVTGAALSADHRHLALVNYTVIVVIDLPVPFEDFVHDAKDFAAMLKLPRRTRLAFLGQTEGVCFDGNDLVMTTESGKDFHIHGQGTVWRVVNVLSVPQAK